MQAVKLVLLLGVSLCGVCGSEMDRSSPDTLSIIMAIKALQNDMKTLQTQVQTLETSQVQFQNRVQTMENSQVQLQNTPQVAFHAGFYDSDMPRYEGPFDMETTLKFKKVLTNIGNGYNSDTGLFTAPVRGLYVFHVTMASNAARPTKSSFFVLKKNSQVLLRIFDLVSEQDFHDSGSNVAVVTMQQGDTVSVELVSTHAFYDYGGKETTFSGFLLSPMALPPQ